MGEGLAGYSARLLPSRWPRLSVCRGLGRAVSTALPRIPHLRRASPRLTANLHGPKRLGPRTPGNPHFSLKPGRGELGLR
jgi:hypothetical protein